MISYTIDQLRGCFESAQVTTGDLIMVHSSLLRLGQLEGHGPRDVPKALGDCLSDTVGTSGTIAVPTFTFEFCRGEAFDRQRSPGVQMGLLSEWFRGQPGAIRSKHPMQSISALGPLAKTLCKPDTLSAFDRGGAFDQLVQLDATVVLLGTDLQAASLIHYSEQHARVPYRYWKEFSGSYRDGDQESFRTYRMYVRNMAMAPQLNMDPVERELLAREEMCVTRLGAGKLRVCSARNLISAANACLQREPTCFVAKGPNEAGHTE